MLQGSQARVRARINSDHFSFELIDYRWDVGVQVHEEQEALTLLWRAQPTRLRLPGRIGGGPVSDFGQLMLLPSGVPLQSFGPTRAAGVSQVVACRFDTDWLRHTMRLHQEAIRSDVCINLSNRQIEYAMRRLSSTLAHPGFASELLAEGLGTTIAADLAGQLFDVPRPDLPQMGLTRQQVDIIDDHLADEANWPPSIGKLAAALGISTTHFRRLFKAYNGQTVHDYVEQLRFNKAKQLLTGTDLPLKIISHRLGFAHPSTFSSAFRRIAGETPRTFRRAQHDRSTPSR